RLRENRADLEEFGTAQKCRFSETLGIGVIEGADDDGHINFSCWPSVGSRRRHVENDFCVSKTYFDVTSSGANGCTTSKMNVTIVISTLNNPI
ncbi:hypothetical protein PRIPAC_86601, partial [Pristionchus pacificus]